MLLQLVSHHNEVESTQTNSTSKKNTFLFQNKQVFNYKKKTESDIIVFVALIAYF